MPDEPRGRYSRQVQLSGIGEEGQQRIRAGVAVIAGCGALGAFQAAALARAGVGRILLIDRDFVEWSNLQRQWLYDEDDARQGLPKAAAAARHIARINSEVTAEARIADLGPDNADELLAGAQVVLDGTDNFETRYLLNDWCVRNGVPWVYGGAIGVDGITFPVVPGRGPCFECVYPDPPAGPQPTCETAGILNAVTSAVASWQTAAALKILAGHAGEVEPRITVFDAWAGTVRQFNLPPASAACPACTRRSFRHLAGKERPPVSLCGRNAVQIHDRRRPLDLTELARRLGRLGTVRSNDFAVRFEVGDYQLTIFPDGRAIVKGTTDPAIARSLYSRYIGN